MLYLAIVAAHDPANSPCTAGETFQHYCNQCVCAADGAGAACTRKACNPEIFNHDGTLKSLESPKLKRDVLPEGKYPLRDAWVYQ